MMSFNFSILNIKNLILTGTVVSSVTVGALALKKAESELHEQKSHLWDSKKSLVNDSLKNIFDAKIPEEEQTKHINLDQYKFLLENKVKSNQQSEFIETSKLKYSDLSPTILQSLSAPKINIKNCDDTDGLTNAVCKKNWFSRYDMSMMSEKSIAGNYVAIFKALSTKTDLEIRSSVYSALIHGLLEWGKIFNFSIDPDIHINLVIDEIKDDFHNNGIVFKNFQFDFTVTNYSDKKTWLFNKFELNPNTTQKVSINLNHGIIKSSPRKVRHSMSSTVSWSFLPVFGNNFVIHIENINKNSKEKVIQKIQSHEADEIKFIYSTIANITIPEYDRRSSFNYHDRKFTNSITWQDLKKIIDPKLKHLTAEDIKKDLEHWYGSYTMNIIKLKLNDIISIIKYVNQDFFINNKGQTENIMEKASKDENARNLLFNMFNLSDWQRKLFSNLFNQLSGNGDDALSKKTLKGFFAFLDSIMHQLQHLFNNLIQTFEWIDDPTIQSASFLSDNGYPTASFKFKQTWKIGEKSYLNFKGTWDSKNKITKQYEENPTSEDEISFDMVDMFLNPDKAFKDILDVFYSDGFFAQMLPGLLKDMYEFFNWEKLTFNTTDYIVTTYSAKESPMSMAVSPSEDALGKNGAQVIGYKFLDIVWNYDIRNFWTIFAQLFNKIQCYKEKDSSGWSLNWWAVFDISGNILKPIQKNPIKQVVHMINSIIGGGYGNNKSDTYLDGCDKSSTSSNKEWKDVDQDKAKNHPWNVFFQKIFRRAFTIDSKQLFVGYTRVLYSYPENFDEKLNELLFEKTTTETKLANILKSFFQAIYSTPTKTSKDFKIFDIEKLNEKLKLIGSSYPISYKDPEIKTVSENIWFNFAFSFPNRPIIVPKTPESMTSLGAALDKDDRFSTTNKFIDNKKSLPEFVISFLQDKSTIYFQEPWTHKNEFFQDIDVQKTKISLVSLEIGEAFKQMLSTNLNHHKLPSAITRLVNIPNILNDAIEREFFLYHVNLFREDGVWSSIKIDNLRILYYDSRSDFYIVVPWKFTMCKLNLESLKSQLLPNCT